ncbi:MAG: hypothetical protein K940chlam2_00109 [Chlamydiae bacterium]|nr:hypothetical protein [Chlamydiota bacterium]
MLVIDSEGQGLDLSQRAVEKLFNFEWYFHLQFSSVAIASKALSKSAVAMKRKELSRRERWLGARFEKEILAGVTPAIYLKWIDSTIGYGVFALRAIPSGTYVGEYTGIIRKRRRYKDRTNDYTFEYTIGDWMRNPYIIDAKAGGNHTRFINHDRVAPNLDTMSVFAGGVMHIIFMAKREIKIDEQLSYDYGDIFWKKRAKEVRGLY